MAYDEDLAERVRAVFGAMPGVTEKHMFGGVCFMVDGHMALGIVKDKLMARFDPARHDEVYARPGVSPMDFTKRAAGMRGLCYVSQDALRSEADLAEWVELGIELARSLPDRTALATAGAKTRPLTRPGAKKAPAAKKAAPTAKKASPAAKKAAPKKAAAAIEKPAPAAKKAPARKR